MSELDPNNANIEIIVEKPEVRLSSIAYLQTCKNRLMRSLPSAEFSDVLPTEIGGKPAHMMTIVAESESVKIHQPYIVIAEGDYIVTLAASFTDEDRALIDQTIASITFEKNTRSDLFLLNNSKGILIV